MSPPSLSVLKQWVKTELFPRGVALSSPAKHHHWQRDTSVFPVTDEESPGKHTRLTDHDHASTSSPRTIGTVTDDDVITAIHLFLEKQCAERQHDLPSLSLSSLWLVCLHELLYSRTVFLHAKYGSYLKSKYRIHPAPKSQANRRCRQPVLRVLVCRFAKISFKFTLKVSKTVTWAAFKFQRVPSFRSRKCQCFCWDSHLLGGPPSSWSSSLSLAMSVLSGS